jgi:hypothetical protein
MQDLCLSLSWFPAFEHVKKSPNRLKCQPQRRTSAGGASYKSLFQLDKWIPAFAGMTLRPAVAEAAARAYPLLMESKADRL